MDARFLVKSLHPLEVKVLLRYGPDDRLDSGRLEAELGYKEGHSNQAFSWLQAKGLAVEDGREARIVYELTPLGHAFAEKGTPEERMLRFLSEKGSARLPDIATALGLEQKDVGSAFGTLSKEGALSMDGDKRAVLSTVWFEASHAAGASKPRIAIVRDLIARAAAAKDGILEEGGLSAPETAAMGGIARKRGAGDAAFRAAERERVWYRLSAGATEVAAELRSQGVTGDELGAVTAEILEKGTWKESPFRPYNINAPAARLMPGRRNAYVEFLEGVKDKLVSLGFEEFDGGLVETEFWNSDALFMPQFHSARDIHDVYHVAEPTKAASIGTIPPRPRPVANRAATMKPMEKAMPVMPVNKENISTVPAKTSFRPQRSAIQPQTHEPTPMPAKPDEPIIPICCGANPNSLEMLGSAYERM